MKHSKTAALAALLLCGCASGSLRHAGADKKAVEGGWRDGTAITITCTTRQDGGNSESGGSPAIAAAAVGIAVDAGLGAISNYLAKEKQARTGAWTAATAGELTACPAGTLTIVRGVFSADTGALINGTSGADGKTVYPAFKLTAGFMVTSNAAVGASASSASSTVTIVPQQLDYAETSARRRGSGRKTVLVSLVVKAADKGTAPGDTAETPTGMVFDLGTLEIGRVYKNFGLKGASVVAASQLQDVVVVVTETEEASIAVSTLAAAFEGNKSDLGKALKEAITEAIGAKP